MRALENVNAFSSVSSSSSSGPQVASAEVVTATLHQAPVPKRLNTFVPPPPQSMVVQHSIHARARTIGVRGRAVDRLPRPSGSWGTTGSESLIVCREGSVEEPEAESSTASVRAASRPPPRVTTRRTASVRAASPPAHPMPTRKPCVVMESRHELGPEWDIDYTLQDSPDWETELLRRRERDL